MAMSGGRDDGSPMMEMNTTPLIDVMLVLLIMMILSIPPATHSVNIDLQIAELGRRLAVRRITVEVSEAARAWLARTGFDPLYGARPLRRLVQTAIGDPLARLLLGGEVLDGSTVKVDVDPSGDGLTLTPAAP